MNSSSSISFWSSQTWRSRIPALIYSVALVALAAAGARYAASNYLTHRALKSASVYHAEKATFLEPGNPGAHEARGVLLADHKDFAAAAGAFEKAILLRPNAYQLWLSLGDAQFQAGDAASAEEAYLRAIELAPAYGRPRMQVGMMYLQLGRRERAFEFLSSAARLDPLYYSTVLNLADVAFAGDAEAIERAVAPGSKEAKTKLALYLIDRARMTEGIRAFLTGDELTSAEKNNLINDLNSIGNYELARLVWLSRIGPDASRGAQEPLFDGGFEMISGSDPSGLGWQIDQGLTSSLVARSGKDVRSGTGALNIRFSGNAEVQRPIVSQLAFIEAGRPYRLTFYFRSGELISGALPAVVATDFKTNAILGWSDPIQDSKGAWVQRSFTFTAPDAPVILVSLQRPACKETPCPIFGEFSIDDVSLTITDR